MVRAIVIIMMHWKGFTIMIMIMLVVVMAGVNCLIHVVVRLFN